MHGASSAKPRNADRKLRSACFSLARGQIDWLQSVAHRQGVSVSQLVRDILTGAMRDAGATPKPSSRSIQSERYDIDDWGADGDGLELERTLHVRLPRSLRLEATGAVQHRELEVELAPPAGFPVGDDLVLS